MMLYAAIAVLVIVISMVFTARRIMQSGREELRPTPCSDACQGK